MNYGKLQGRKAKRYVLIMSEDEVTELVTLLPDCRARDVLNILIPPTRLEDVWNMRLSKAQADQQLP